MSHLVRRAAALVAVPALALGALVAAPGAATAAPDPAPATQAGTWLVGQLQDGLVHSQEWDYDDIGGTIDVALSLDAVGAPEGVVGGIVDAVEANLDGYIGTGGEEYAGATAKAAVLARMAGEDPAGFGGVDLISRLEGRVLSTGAVAGRTQDQSEYGDYASTFGQVWAVEALDAAGSDLADAATDFLLAQQCEDGYFRAAFADLDADDQTCDGGDGQPSVDATAYAVWTLQSQLDDSDVKAAVDAAVAWLVSAQEADGAFGSDADIPTGNANSTGLAGYALQLGGEEEAAARAAAWLRAHQATNLANCVYYDESSLGAVLYDDSTLEAARTEPLAAPLLDQTVRATAQALPALVAAPAADGDAHGMFTAEYVKAGRKTTVGVAGAAPGEAVCAMLGEQSVLGYADADGELDLELLIPAGTRTNEVALANAAGTFDTLEVNALGKAKLKVAAKKKVKKGKQVKVTVKGLAPAESVTVAVRGKRKAGQANAKGVFKTKVKVTGKPGKAKVKAVGQFKNRKGNASVTVVK